MSLLLKALKQAEASNPGRFGGDRSDASGRTESSLELEPAPGLDKAREWVEPPPLLLGGNSPAPESVRRPAFRLPQLSLVPLTALLAALIATGYGIYLYFELQPPAPVAPQAASTAASATPAAEPIVAMPSPAVQPPASPPFAAVPAPVIEAPADEVPASPAVALPPMPSAVPVASRPAAPAADRPVAPSALPRFQPDTQATLLGQAYAAYQRGALAEAQQFYTQAVARTRSVDALLGLAAIAGLQNRDADAQRLYREVLELDPRNATAQGALLDLLGNTDSQATESRLKTLIAREPAPHLYQTLGNLYADQGRWNEAQTAYFEAFRAAPGNADYAFNLAVSLDQLRQYPAALTYYEKALSLEGAHRFDRAQAATRVQQLKSVR